MKIAVSACLLGENCKYNGGNNYNEKVAEFVKGHEVLLICPEVLGGLSTPRNPAEIVGGSVQTQSGMSVDSEFRSGAEKALKIVLENDVDLVILQPRSPSCGNRQVYDGSFSGKLVSGRGVFAQMLSEHGIKIIEPCDL